MECESPAIKVNLAASPFYQPAIRRIIVVFPPEGPSNV